MPIVFFKSTKPIFSSLLSISSSTLIQLYKYFAELTPAGKKRRIVSLFKRTPDKEERQYIADKENIASHKRSNLSPVEQRKIDNKALILHFDVDLGRARYRKAAQRHGWASYCQVKIAKEKMLYPKEISYGAARVEVSLSSLIAHSTSRLLEFFFEQNSPLVNNLSDAQKSSLELWAKVGGDGQVEKPVQLYVTYCQMLLVVHFRSCCTLPLTETSHQNGFVYILGRPQRVHAEKSSWRKWRFRLLHQLCSSLAEGQWHSDLEKRRAQQVQL